MTRRIYLAPLVLAVLLAISVAALFRAVGSRTETGGMSQTSGPTRAGRTGGLLAIVPSTLEVRVDDGGGVVRRVHVTLSNPGQIPVSILSIESSCNCTIAAPLSQTTLQPGESVSLALSVTLPAPGYRETSFIRVHTDSAQMPEARLTLQLVGSDCNLPTLLAAQRQLQVVARPGDELVRAIVIHTREEASSEPWIRSVSTTDDRVAAHLQSIDLDTNIPYPNRVERTYHIDVAIKVPATNAAGFVASLSFEEARAGTAPLAPLRVVADVEPYICALPSHLTFAEEPRLGRTRTAR
jgi:hypothetical protein